MKDLYKDCQKDYETNLGLFISTNSKKAWDNIFHDFKTYCFNKIKKMRPFLPNSTVDDWAVNVTLNALTAIRNKGELDRNNWPANMGAYLSLFCLDINNSDKYSPERREVELDYSLFNEEDEPFMVINDKPVDTDVLDFIVKEAIKMTVYNDGFNMVDVDRAIKLSIKYNGKIGQFSDKNRKIMNSLKKNIESILNGNVRGEK